MTTVAYEEASDRPLRLQAKRGAAGVRALAGALRPCWRVGALTVIAPDGISVRLEGGEPGLDATLRVKDPRFVSRILKAGDVGFADSFIAGEWDTPDLATLLCAFSANFDNLANIMDGNPVARFMQWMAHALNRNSRSGARRNILAHYDLGNAFYRLWLDEGLNYSSGLYLRPDATLEEAQAAKHRALAEAMDLKPGMSLLEIGCGWGGFAAFAAREYDARVTAVTISPAQHAYARRRIEQAGLSDKVDIQLLDYRLVEGRFDRIASIEMFEAVGEAYWPTYFDKVRSLLAPGGKAGLQIITIRDDLFEGYRRRPDFIQLQIFPGGMLPSEARLDAELARAGLNRTAIRRFGLDYAHTLAEWGRRYRGQLQAVRAEGFDDAFDRLWRYYLGYCEAGFRTGRTDVVQVALEAG
jgi:cyclopropane-fatty-acyl-phospholipid synthase